MAPSLRRSPPWPVPLSFRWQRRRAVPAGLAGGSRPSTERRRLTPSGKERSPAIRKGGPGRCQSISRQNRENENGQSGEIWKCYVEIPPGVGLDWVAGRARLLPSLGDKAVRNSESVRRAVAFPIRISQFVCKGVGIFSGTQARRGRGRTVVGRQSPDHVATWPGDSGPGAGAASPLSGRPCAPGRGVTVPNGHSAALPATPPVPLSAPAPLGIPLIHWFHHTLTLWPGLVKSSHPSLFSSKWRYCWLFPLIPTDTAGGKGFG
jgi:hypothetical protein